MKFQIVRDDEDTLRFNCEIGYAVTCIGGDGTIVGLFGMESNALEFITNHCGSVGRVMSHYRITKVSLS